MFNTTQFLKDNFTSAPVLVATLESYRFTPPNLEAVKKWFSRGSVPGDWLAVLLSILEFEEGAPVSVIKYMEWPR